VSSGANTYTYTTVSAFAQRKNSCLGYIHVGLSVSPIASTPLPCSPRLKHACAEMWCAQSRHAVIYVGTSGRPRQGYARSRAHVRRSIATDPGRRARRGDAPQAKRSVLSVDIDNWSGERAASRLQGPLRGANRAVFFHSRL
jgi:hypothetical protein